MFASQKVVALPFFSLANGNHAPRQNIQKSAVTTKTPQDFSNVCISKGGIAILLLGKWQPCSKAKSSEIGTLKTLLNPTKIQQLPAAEARNQHLTAADHALIFFFLGRIGFSSDPPNPSNGISPFIARSTSGSSSACGSRYTSRKRLSEDTSAKDSRNCPCRFPALLSTANTAHLREWVSRLRTSKVG
ncbi:hypothetical protein SETIT_3G242100v2 [Setaria italica]|uniref:Uncharacterized protein n=1 Tax=Setaria italica TaxID=4555 RepID=A0A368QKB8_SETIT|nr:hypothetical protein SETIT_3G242100v2 [Setaria italica]